ncbi:MAG TPA: hypothetical protein PLP35_09380 [Caldisericia bacterium]|nr:hypothetical protein [Caldisericia bacterium]
MREYISVIVCITLLYLSGCSVTRQDSNKTFNKGKFEMIWNHGIRGLRGGVDQADFAGVTSTDKGWIFQGEYYVNGSNKLANILINPKTGEYKQYDDLVLGIANGDDIIGYNNISGISSLKCVSTDTLKTKWDSGYASGISGFSIFQIGDSIIEHNKTGATFKSYRALDGVVLWERNSLYPYDVFPIRFGNTLYFISSRPDEKAVVEIDEKSDGTVEKTIDCDLVIGNVFNQGDKIFANVVDSTGFVEIIFKDSDIDIQEISTDYWIVDSFTSGLLLGKSGVKDGSVSFAIFIDDNIIPISGGFVDINIVNIDVIARVDNGFQSLNPQTLEPIWWIDLENEELGENPRVIWCDWRGVLVMSDTKLACFVASEN